MANSFSILSSNIITKLSEMDITTPTNVQEKIIPIITEGKNILFQSETGTGKTYAYLLPLIEKLEKDGDKTSVKILIIAPTFELASQINSMAKKITDRKTALLIGGAPLKRQIETLKEKPQIVTGTSARLIELIRLKKLKIEKLDAVIFDEADRLIKKESIEEIKELKSLIPQNAIKIACSATITNQAKKFFDECELVVMPDENVLSKNIMHWAIFAENREKIDSLRKFIIAANPSKTLIFTSRADQVENIFQKLKYKKIECEALHAKADKVERKAAFDKFKNGKCKILVTSDLSARGLDIPNISHIIQMDLPEDSDFFVHRAGRTARAGKSGINVVIGDEIEMRRFSELEKKLKIIVYPKEIRGGRIIEPI